MSQFRIRNPLGYPSPLHIRISIQGIHDLKSPCRPGVLCLRPLRRHQAPALELQGLVGALPALCDHIGTIQEHSSDPYVLYLPVYCAICTVCMAT